jgi:hypothetical protein
MSSGCNFGKILNGCLFVYESEFWFHYFTSHLQQVRASCRTRNQMYLSWFVENATKFKLTYEITLITNNFQVVITEIYNCWKKDCFQPFKTWKPVWICNFAIKDIKVKDNILPIQNTIIYLRLIFKRNGSCWNAF